jgi:hypothetical protein
MPQDFNAAEQQAIIRAQEMYRRSANVRNGNPAFQEQPNQPPKPNNAENNIKSKPLPKPEQPDFQRKNNPFGMFFDGDMKLIIAMLLLLSGDNCDTMLLMALVYIML